jgi:hypothetical protein
MSSFFETHYQDLVEKPNGRFWWHSMPLPDGNRIAGAHADRFVQIKLWENLFVSERDIAGKRVLDIGAEANPDRSIEPRLNQIFLPLLSIIEDPNDREEMKALARRYHSEMIAERGMDLEAHVLEAIRDLKEAGRPLVVKDIASWLQDRHGDEYERKITTRWIGSVVRKKLQLTTRKSHGNYAVLPEELSKLDRLY